MKKFSKSLKDIQDIKEGYLNDNDKHLWEVQKINNKYCQQTLRIKCKNCLSYIDSNDIDFISHGVGYSICSNCGHLNGAHEDSEEFCSFLYVDEGGVNYPTSYLSNYNNIIEKIYAPKVNFLIDSLKELDDCNISISDFGCGAGHFVIAANQKGIKAFGFDVSEISISEAINFSKINSIQPTPFKLVKSEAQLLQATLTSTSTVLSFLGVLEHLQNPSSFIQAFCNSKAKYLFISVPMFSFSVFIESIFSNVFPRLLGGGHTHLYTKRSIQYLLDINKLNLLGSWHFGSDAMDLRRSILVELVKNKCSPGLIKVFSDEFFSINILDQMQEIFDRNLVCSEVHLLIEKKK